MSDDVWTDVGAVDDLAARAVQEVTVGRAKVALTFKDGAFGAISGVCNHVGGPLGKGSLDGDYVVCPWHYWKFHCRTGVGEPGYEADRVPAHEVKMEAGRVLVRNTASSTRAKAPHTPHPLARPVQREAGPIRILGISTTAMTVDHPRYSTSDALLEHALSAAATDGHCETQLVRLRELQFRDCATFIDVAGEHLIIENRHRQVIAVGIARAWQIA